MSKGNKSREEPKLRMEDLENEFSGSAKKTWPIDEGDRAEESGDEIVGVLDHPSYLELAKKLTEEEARSNDYHNQQLRTQAELENVQRRARLDVMAAREYGLKNFTEELLPVLDSLERALLSEVHGNDYARKIHEGIELTMSLFLKTLEKFGIKQIDPVNQPFNPELHQAIATRESDQASNTVIEVLQKGYSLNDRLVRPALVVVCS